MADTDETKAGADKAAKDVPGADASPSSPSPAGGPAQKGAVQITAPEDAFQHDETVEGGVYAVKRGKTTVMVNAHGRRVNEDGERVNADGTVLTTAELLAERLELSEAEMDSLRG